jgi:hypothetical protein
MLEVEHSWRTIRDWVVASVHTMSVPTSMWSCTMSTVMHLRHAVMNFSRVVVTSVVVPLTLHTSVFPDASGSRVFGCVAFAKVLDAQCKCWI